MRMSDYKKLFLAKILDDNIYGYTRLPPKSISSRLDFF